MRSDSMGPKLVPGAGQVFDVNVNGQFASVCLEVTGTITAGYLRMAGSLQAPTPVQLYTEDVSTGTSLGNGQIIQAGLYRVASAALIHVFVEASEAFAQDPNDPVSVYVTYSETLPPISIVGSV